MAILIARIDERGAPIGGDGHWRARRNTVSAIWLALRGARGPKTTVPGPPPAVVIVTVLVPDQSRRTVTSCTERSGRLRSEVLKTPVHLIRRCVVTAMNVRRRQSA